MTEIYVVEEYGTPTLAFRDEDEAREFVDERPGRVISQIPLQEDAKQKDSKEVDME